MIFSFGYKFGVPEDADFVFDVRCLANPYWESHLAHFTGKDPEIVDFLQKQAETQDILSSLADFLDTWIPRFVSDNRPFLNVAIGCTGGQHRSVYVAETLYRHFKEKFEQVLLKHRELS